MYYGNHQEMRGGCGYASKRAGGFGAHWSHAHGGGRYQPPVNIEELEDRYELQLAAPGRTGADFQINVRADVLTISCRPQEENGSAASAQWSRREFRTSAFERQFLLNEKIDAESISARYADGILVVMLPKHPEAHTPAKDIFVA